MVKRIMTSIQRRRTTAVALAVFTIVVGLVWRLAPLPLPFVAYKYGGSMLWAFAIYWLITAVIPQRSIATVTITSSLLAASIEFFKLYHSTAVDAFRMTLPGKLILGRIFSWKDLVAYGLAIAMAALLDRTLLRHSTAKLPKA